MASLNLRAWIAVAPNSADFGLILNAVNEKGEPVYSVGHVKVDDPQIGTRLRDMIQAYRAGTNVGKET